MPLPTLTKTWSFSNNNRISFVSLNDTMARFLFGIKNFLVATMAYTVKYTCDGTTGPTSGADHTDRWSTFSNVTTRGANAASAQSFAVLTDGNGVDILLTYQGASDDICRISFSNTAAFTPAGTSNQQPTAADEAVILSAVSVIGSTATLDRVWSIQASTDKKMFRTFIFRSSTLNYMFGVEQATRDSNVLASFAWSPTVVGWSSNQTNVFGGGGGNGSAAANNSGFARLNTTNAQLFNTSEYWDSVSVIQPELQAFVPMLPYGSACISTTNFFGRLCDRIDTWTTHANVLSQGDTFGTLQFVFIGTYMLPWDGTTTPVIA